MGVLRTKVLYATGSFDGTNQDNVAHIELSSDCELVTIVANCDANLTTTGDKYVFEISATGNFQATDLGAVGSIAILGERMVGAQAAGYSRTSQNVSIAFTEPPKFLAGERVYLNLSGTNGVGYNFRAVLHFRERGKAKAKEFVTG